MKDQIWHIVVSVAVAFSLAIGLSDAVADAQTDDESIAELQAKFNFISVDSDPDSIRIVGHSYMDALKKAGRMSDYYETWMLVQHYLAMEDRLLLASEENRNMVEEVRADRNEIGLICAYIAQSSMYYKSESFSPYNYNMRKAYDLIRVTDKHIANEPSIMANWAGMLMNKGYVDEAREILEYEADRPLPDSSEVSLSNDIQLKAHMVQYYALQPDPSIHAETMKRLLGEIDKESIMIGWNPFLYYARFYYYKAFRNYSKALSEVKVSYDAGLMERLDYYKVCMEVYEAMGDKDNSYASMKRYVAARDSVLDNISLVGLQDISAALAGAEIGVENQRLELNNSRLGNTIISLGGIIIIIMFLFILSQSRKNRKLRRERSKLEKAISAAEAAARAKTVFLQNMNHEIRTPLNSIVGFSNVIAASARGDNTLAEYADRVRASSEDLMHVVDDVVILTDLDASAPRSGEIKWVYINDVIAKVMKECRMRPKKGVKVSTSLVPETFAVGVDVVNLERALSEVYENALKFTSEGFVRVIRTRSGNIDRIVIEDTGPGIPAEHRDVIFDRFNKVDDFSSGTGLGLAVAKSAMAQIGGDISLDETYAGGVRMVLDFPVSLPSSK